MIVPSGASRHKANGIMTRIVQVGSKVERSIFGEIRAKNFSIGAIAATQRMTGKTR